MEGTLNENQITKIIQVLLEKMVYKDMAEWPPVCLGWAYQPIRPMYPKEIVKHMNKKL